MTVLIVWTLAVLSLGFTLGAISPARSAILGATGVSAAIVVALGMLIFS